MWVTVHLCSGLALGATWPGPAWTAVPAGVAEHALLDAVPHWDYTRHHLRLVWAGLDVALAVVTLGAAARMARGRPRCGAALLAGAAATLPDLDVIDGLFPRRRTSMVRRRTRWFPSHFRSYPHGEASPLVGTAIQSAVVALSAALFLRRFPPRREMN